MERTPGNGRMAELAIAIAGELGFELHDTLTGGASDANHDHRRRIADPRRPGADRRRLTTPPTSGSTSRASFRAPCCSPR
jgi:hypothetical protein